MNSTNPARVLVIDEYVDASGTLADLLKMMGCEVIATVDGDAGVAIASRYIPDVLIVDLEMQRCNVLDLIQRLQAQMQFSDTVFIATYCRETALDQSGSARIARCIQKPYDPDEICRAVAERNENFTLCN